MDGKSHVVEFVQARIDVAGRARHSSPDRKTCARNPFHNYFIAKTTLDLPLQVSADRSDAPFSRKGMLSQKMTNVTEWS
jgi:hypothetical protein